MPHPEDLSFAGVYFVDPRAGNTVAASADSTEVSQTARNYNARGATSAVSVFRDLRGNHYALYPASPKPLLISMTEPQTVSFEIAQSCGGFVSASQIDGMAAGATRLTKQQLNNLRRFHAVVAETTPQSALPMDGADRSAIVATPKTTDSGNKRATGFQMPFGPVGQQLFGQAIAQAAVGASPNNIFDNIYSNVPALGMSALGRFVGAQLGSLLNGWQVGDSSSTGELAAKMVTDKLMAEISGAVTTKLGEIISDAMSDTLIGRFPISGPTNPLDELQKIFRPVESTAFLGAAYEGSSDNRNNTVKALTASTVKVNGFTAAAALSRDVMVPASRLLLDGSLTVSLAEGSRMFARISSKTLVPSVVTGGSKNVLIGGPSPVAAASAAAAKILASDPTALDKANKKSREVGTAAEAMRNAVLKRGGSQAEADAAAIKEGEGVAQRRDHDVKREAIMAELAYHDGKPSSFDDKETITKPPLKEKSFYDAKGNVVDPAKVSEYYEAVKIYDEESTGIRSVVFRDETGQTFLVNNGTSSTEFASDPDWIANVAQGLGFIPKQYDQALDFATKMQSEHPGMMVVGHSLGGGLSLYVAGMTGMPATIFNAAGPGAGTLSEISINGTGFRPDQIQHLRIQGEVLTGVSVLFGQPEANGDTIILPYQERLDGHKKELGMAGNHGIDAIIQALDHKPIGHELIAPRLPPLSAFR